MSCSFIDASAPPDDAALTAALGPSKKAWDTLVALLESDLDDVDVAWKFYGKSHGWQLKATRRKKAVLYMVPHEGKFVAAMALKGEALEALAGAGLPEALVEEIQAAKLYAEGKPARVEVTSAREVGTVTKLLALKLV